MPNQKNNPCNRQNFNSACALLAHAAPQNTFNVQNIWMDYGAGMMWETIICTRPDGSSYQVLSPRDWDRLQTADLLEEVEGVVADIIESQRRTLGIPEGKTDVTVSIGRKLDRLYKGQITYDHLTGFVDGLIAAGAITVKEGSNVLTNAKRHAKEVPHA